MPEAWYRVIALSARTLLTGLAVSGAFADEPATRFYAEDIKAAMTEHLDAVIPDDGRFRIRDDVKAEDLALYFVQIHDPVRQIGDDVYFACTDFHVPDQPDKLYDIDFWLRENAQGELQVYQTKIHKEPRHSLLYGWFKHPRYTFVNDQIEYLYD